MSTVNCLFVLHQPLAAGHKCREHGHGCTEIVLTTGSGILGQDNTTYPLARNSVMIYQPGGGHWVVMDEDCLHTCIGVSGLGASKISPGVFDSNMKLLQWFGEIQTLLKENDPLRRPRLDLLAGLIALELQSLQDNGRPAQNIGALQNIKTEMDTRFTEGLSIRELAASVFMSPDYLRQMFKKQFGESPVQYLIRQRIDFACNLLRSSRLPVKEIAAECGIENPYYFTRLFHRVMGQTPSVYREKHYIKEDVNSE